MQYDENKPRDNQDERSVNEGRAGGYRVENDNSGIQEKDLRRSPILGQGQMQDVHEGQPMGGHKFQQDGNPTPTGDDPANPSRNAGYSNAYFARTAPSEEYPENNNFKAAHQQGAPNYEGAQVNNPGPQELPDQQKVGESPDVSQPGKAADSPDFNHKPSYGSQHIAEEKDHIET